MMLTTFQKLGEHRGSPRIWIESTRLQQLGFEPKTFLDVQARGDNTLRLVPVSHRTKNRVSFRLMSGLDCPIVDLNSAQMLSEFRGHSELKLQASYKMIQVGPSIRSFNILRHREHGLPIKTIEYFAGGGTLSSAITDDSRFQLVAAVEISPKFASHFALEHPEVPLFQCDVRELNPLDLPKASFMFASLPCTCFSPAGVAKKQLKDRSALGDTGDLFVTFASHVAAHMPLMVVVENVPNFFGDKALAGQILMANLERLGYHVHLFDLRPFEEWNEPQDRRRTVMIASLFSKFYPSIPNQPFQGKAGDYLDQPNPELDKKEADEIRNSISGRQRHMERHKAAGNNFGFTVIDHESTRVPTILRSSWKINRGPFIVTPYGLRMPRQQEVERLMGFEPKKGFTSKSYPTAIEILGQGVQTRIFRQILRQVGDYLEFVLKRV